MNQLTVENNNTNPLNQNHHLKPRKSIIGKLERSSFQGQRLSDVGTAFSQQITAKVGLKLPASQERIVEQTRWLYLRYVFVKLRQNKLPLRDLNLTKSSRARRATALGASSEAQILVSISEPPSANNLPLSCQRPTFTSARKSIDSSFLNFSNGKKRSTLLTSQLNSEGLSFLASRVGRKRQTFKRQREHINWNNDELVEEVNFNQIQSVANNDINSPNLTVNLSTTHLGSISNNLQSKDENKQRDDATTNYSLYGVSGGGNFASTSGQATQSKKYVMDSTINNQIFTVITNMIKELRESKPEFYGDTIYEMIGLDKFSSLESLLEVQKTLCQEMTRVEISWDRIIALFSLFGAMSLDCVRLGAPEHVGPILDGFIGFVERDLALWISQQGGWESFLYKFRAGYHYGKLYKLTALSIPILIVWAFLIAYSNHHHHQHHHHE